MKPRWWRQALAYALAAAGLAWVFHDVHPVTALHSVRLVHPWLVPLAIAFDILTYVCQGFRWSILLRPVGRLGAFRATQAVYAGLFTNEIVPLRAGELVRAVLVSRWLRIGVVPVLPSMLLERMLDAAWLAVGIGVTAIVVSLPPSLAQAADIFGGAVLVVTLVFVLFVLSKEKQLDHGHQPLAAGSGVSARIRSALVRVASGLRQVGLSRLLGEAALLSAAVLGTQMVAFWLLMRAYGIAAPFWVGAGALIAVRVGTALPNAPANVGTYQFFCVLGLTLFGVNKVQASGFSVVVFLILTIPLWLLGMLAISRSGTSLGRLRREIRVVDRLA